MEANRPIIILHNLDPDKFVWLWAKYVRGVNDTKHCTNSILGRYSKKLSKHNPELTQQPELVLDEEPGDSYKAIYICGVAKKGYSAKKNYPHNLHTAVMPKPGTSDEFHFEDWHLKVENGVFMPIPTEDELPERYKDLPAEFVTCRIYRWAVGFQEEYLK